MTTTNPPRPAIPSDRDATQVGRSYDVAVFLGLTFLLATLLAVTLPGSDGHEGPVALLTAFVPAVAAGATRHVVRTPARPWGLRRLALRAWPVALVAPLVAVGGSHALAWALGVIDVHDLDGYIARAPLQLLVLMVILLGEEIGWRGFLLPRLLDQRPVRAASLLTGLAHGVFHVPLLLLTAAYDPDGNRWVVVPGVVTVVACGGVVFGWLRTRYQSLWPVLVAHATVNLCLLSAPELVTDRPDRAASITGEGGVLTVLMVGAMAAVTWRWLPWTRRRSPTTPPPSRSRADHGGPTFPQWKEGARTRQHHWAHRCRDDDCPARNAR